MLVLINHPPTHSSFLPSFLTLADRLFPYEQMFEWLSYGNDPDGKNHAKVDPTFFLRREWSFTLADDIYIRYNCFRDHREMKAAMMKRQPHKIDIGAVFSLPPKDHLGGAYVSASLLSRAGGNMHPLGRERIRTSLWCKATTQLTN